MAAPSSYLDPTPGDFPLLHAAKTAIRGHRAIAERIAEQAARMAAERTARAAIASAGSSADSGSRGG